MVKRFDGKSSKNARIKIDYRDKNPKVNFSYPSKKHQKEFTMLPRIFTLWILIWMLILITGEINEKEYLDLSNHSLCMVYQETVCDSLEKGVMYNLQKDLKESMEYLFEPRVLLFFLLLVVPPLLIYFPFEQKWKDYFPKHQGKRANKKLVVFKPKDIRKDEKGYFVEIPVFKNIILNYKTTRDSQFSKYLYLCEIREHNFKYVVSEKLEGDKKKEKELNEYIWYARFSFSKKPTTGQLKVLFC